MTKQNTAPAVKPVNTPACPNFSSGPCPKRPGWDISKLKLDTMGRSHRAKVGKDALKAAIDKAASTLGVPDDWKVGIVPASDTGAFEMAMWSMLGERGVDALAWESFGSGWVTDAQKQLKLEDLRILKAGYGALPNLDEVDFSRDVLFTWNGTTSGVKVPNGDFIPSDREGLVFCDATSAVYAQDMPWDKLDVVTWSWQKALGSEGGHGMLMLSPRAVERLESYTPDRALPKIFRLTKGGKLIDGIFKGATINTPSMLAVSDFLDAIEWVETVGGAQGTIKRANDNFAVIEQWVAQTDWVDFLAEKEETRSNSSVCLSFVSDSFTALSEEDQAAFAKKFVKLLEEEGVAYDIGAYRDAPAGLRIWCGPTVEASDLQALTPWLDWAYNEIA